MYQLNQTKIFTKESEMIATVLTHWRQQEFIEVITIIAGAYIGKTKGKIKELIAEHKRDVKLNKETTVLAKLNRNDDIEIDFIRDANFYRLT